MEDVKGRYILDCPGTREQIKDLYAVRDRYRLALKANHVIPWIEPEIKNHKNYLSKFVREKFQKWLKISQDLFPQHPFRQEGDNELISRAISILEKGYEGVISEFQQGHFSHRDVVRVGEEIVMFSNLYWSWRAPFYDAIFPYHWYMLDLVNIPGMTIEEIEKHRELWKDYFRQFEKKLSAKDKKLFQLARLERLAAGLNMDALSVSADPANTLAEYTVSYIRKELSSLSSKGY